jgi:hypothetical protein
MTGILTSPARFTPAGCGFANWNHFASGLPGQYFALVEIQALASASVSKSPI